MTKIKICGLKEVKHVNQVVKEGVDAIGTVVNVPKSPRNITVEQALSLKKLIPPFISYTCVTIPNFPMDVRMIEKELQPDVLQIHAIKPESFFEQLRKLASTKLILGLPINQDGNSKVIEEDPVTAGKILAKFCDALLFDSYSAKTIGGSGILSDWNIAKKVQEAIDVPLILSGGLNPNNVKKAIETVHPYAVDVSSGVESAPGVKDEKLISEFIKMVREG